MERVIIRDEFIKLGQAMKLAGYGRLRCGCKVC